MKTLYDNRERALTAGVLCRLLKNIRDDAGIWLAMPDGPGAATLGGLSVSHGADPRVSLAEGTGRELTAGALRRALGDVPDDAKIHLHSPEATLRVDEVVVLDGHDGPYVMLAENASSAPAGDRHP